MGTKEINIRLLVTARSRQSHRGDGSSGFRSSRRCTNKRDSLCRIAKRRRGPDCCWSLPRLEVAGGQLLSLPGCQSRSGLGEGDRPRRPDCDRRQAAPQTGVQLVLDALVSIAEIRHRGLPARHRNWAAGTSSTCRFFAMKKRRASAPAFAPSAFSEIAPDSRRRRGSCPAPAVGVFIKLLPGIWGG